MVVSSIRSELTIAGIDGDATLRRVVTMPRADVIGQISDSGLKGRGGAGFPTGVKWNLTAAAQSDRKFVVCNADEGEPGTFKDRVLLTEFPDACFIGMTVAGYATGAKEGVLYLRAEYTYLRRMLEERLAARRQAGLLGENVAGKTGFTFDIVIRMGAGAYICGEETALIESMEGQRGEPRNRPPFPVNTGYMGHPTTVNNVETLCWALAVLAKGADWFKSVGTEHSPGPKLLSVSGDCDRPGVFELPFGTTVQELLEHVGGLDAKAVQIGGASGKCVTREDFDQPIAYEGKATGGSIIVFGPDRDMLHVLEDFMTFFVEESCGQCTPCREGNAQLLDGVHRLQQGRCSMRQLNNLRSLCETMQLASKCGLGQSSPNPFLSIVDGFNGEILGRQKAPLTNGKEH